MEVLALNLSDQTESENQLLFHSPWKLVINLRRGNWCRTPKDTSFTMCVFVCTYTQISTPDA